MGVNGISNLTRANNRKKEKENFKILNSKISVQRHCRDRRINGARIADLKPNAEVISTMAPALTEPISPTEKLNNSSVRATRVAPSTRSSRKSGTVTSTTVTLTSTNSNKEKKGRTITVAASTSTRVTRSKDAFQRDFDKAVTEKSETIETTLEPKINVNNNEQMGLNAILITNNNCIETTNNCKENSTAQLLADLTSDIEEAISADICLRNQLKDANLDKSVKDTNTSDSKDIFVIKAGSDKLEAITKSHMESPLTTEIELNVNNVEQNDENENKAELLTETTNNFCTNIEYSSKVKDSEQTIENQSQQLSVVDLNPISTDSTMTASEVEDNIEERLSQLDGTTGEPTPCVESTANNKSTEVYNELNTIEINKFQTVDREQQAIQQNINLQQLENTPMTPTQQPVVQAPNILTPQSTSSSIGNSLIKDASGGELEDQDIEEMLKALKGLDPAAGADTLCDLNNLFSDVYTGFNYEENFSQATLSTKSYHKEVVKIEIGRDASRTNDTIAERIHKLLQRLRAIQSRRMLKHTSEEIAGLFEWSGRISNKNNRNNHINQDSTTNNSLTVIASRPPATTWDEDKKSPVSLTHMFSMLQKLQAASNSQQLCTNSGSTIYNNFYKKSKKSVQDDIAQVSNNIIVPTYDIKIIEEIKNVAGLLQTEIREIQHAIDSDATESSSGGESADEMITYSNNNKKPLSITKRAAWRYSRDRASIGSRWSWLVAQIADLELKIQQHSKLYQEIVLSKGAVTCDEDVIPTTSDAPQTTSSENNKVYENTCCRTRGFNPSLFRKRKLLQTTNIHTISKKAARPSTVKCGCQWPLHPCALCTGRPDPTAPRDLPDTMMMSDRVALLDAGYHPVLSFPEDVNNAIHFEAIARLPEWQHKMMRCQVKSIAKSVWRASREASNANVNLSKKYHDSSAKRRYIKKKDRVAAEERAAMDTYAGTSTGSPNQSGNGTASSSTTPIMANKTTKIAKKTHSYSTPNGAYTNSQMTTSATVTSSQTLSQNYSNNFIHRTNEYQNSEHSSPNQAHSSLISNSNNYNYKNSKNRKLSSASANQYNNIYSQHNNGQYTNFNGNSESNLHISDNWETQRSRTSSPTHGGSFYYKNERVLDRKNRSSYDIDNIVIPYSVAASTRVEILPYKEIPTPKWRCIEDEDTCDESTANEEDKAQIDDKLNCIDNNDKLNANNDESNNKVLNVYNISNDITKECTEKSAETSKSTEKEEQTTTAEAINCDDHTSNKQESVCNVKNSGETDTNVDQEPPAKKLKSDNIFKTTPNESDVSMLHDLSNSSQTISAEELEEDVSDDAMILRHERAFTEERRRFQTFLKFPWSTRSRANRRVDSRAESSGANTPDPTSPAPHTSSIGGDQESIPSPLAPSTPNTPLDSVPELNDTGAGVPNSALSIVNTYNNYTTKRQERRRTTSTKKDREIERRSSTPDMKEFIPFMPPFEQLLFPLSSEKYDTMLQLMPSSHVVDEDVDILSYDTTLNDDNNLKNNATSSSTISRSMDNSNLHLSKKQKPNNAVNRKGVSFESDYHMNGRDANADFDVDLQDDYPKHHLLANDEFVEEHFDAYVGRSNLCGDSDDESSENDPFQDDDPNDPEWKGGFGERTDRLRKKF